MAKNVGVEVKAGTDLVNFVPYEHRRSVISLCPDFQTAIPKGGLWADEPVQAGTGYGVIVAPAKAGAQAPPPGCWVDDAGFRPAPK